MQKPIEDLEPLIDQAMDAFTTAINQLKTDVVDRIESLTVTEVVEKVVAIVLDLVLKTAEEIILAAIDVIALVVREAVSLLETSINIPVISPLYRKATGAELSILDLACLVTAIPVTVIYKMAYNETPFPAGDETDQLTTLGNFPAIQRLYSPVDEAQGRALPATSPGDHSEDAPNEGKGNKPAANPAQIRWERRTNLMAFFSSLGMIGVSTLKSDFPNNPCLAILGAGIYLPYVAPDIAAIFFSKSLPVVFNTDVTAASVGVAVAQAVTFNYVPSTAKVTKPTDPAPTDPNSNLGRIGKALPWVEAVINFVWIFPAIGMFCESSRKVPDGFGLAANMAFDAGGMLAPCVNAAPGLFQTLSSAIPGLTLLYGLCSLGAIPLEDG